MKQKILRLWENWKHYRGNIRDVLAINARNLQQIYPNNKRRNFPYADDKMLAKTVLAEVGIAVPRTHFLYSYFFELRTLAEDLSSLDAFVIKPAHGRAGGGILVIERREGERWITPGGRELGLQELHKHISDIVFGIYSFSMADQAIVEEKISPHPLMQEVSPLGLADIRIILKHHKSLMAMMRVPTSVSQGKANLHQGALGVGLDIQSGVTTQVVLGGKHLQTHPDTGGKLLGIQLPFWTEILHCSELAAQHIPLKYLGVDIVLGKEGPIMLEVNARPGIEIQNVNSLGLRRRLREEGV